MNSFYTTIFTTESGTKTNCCDKKHATTFSAFRCASQKMKQFSKNDNVTFETGRVRSYDRQNIFRTIELPQVGDSCGRCKKNGRNGHYVASKIEGVIECNECPNVRDSRLDFRYSCEVAKAEGKEVIDFRNPNERGERHTPKTGHAHPCFSDMVNRIKMGTPVMIVGEAGTGKTFIAEQVAEYLDRPFGTISCSGGMSESQLTGRLIPIGESGKFEYVPTQLVKMVREGGIFLADEFDAADPNVALVLNQLSANRRLVLPNNPEEPVIEAHPDFALVFSANTFGTGADRQYVGRNQMDAATLDRVAMGTIHVDYDNGLEKKLVANSDLRKAFQTLRRKVRAARIRRVVSMRAMLDAQKYMTNLGWSVEECVDQLAMSWTQDERAKAGVPNR